MANPRGDGQPFKNSWAEKMRRVEKEKEGEGVSF
jgi:hypothetical protein